MAEAQAKSSLTKRSHVDSEMDGVAQAAEIAGQQLRCKRVGVDAQSIFDRLRKVDPAAWECKFMEAGEHQILAVPSGQPLSMFSPSRWSMCFFSAFLRVRGAES